MAWFQMSYISAISYPILRYQIRYWHFNIGWYCSRCWWYGRYCRY